MVQGLIEDDVYEGNMPYVFISYSHRDEPSMQKVKNALFTNKIRYWYDNGLHSGDDWNLVIANHLQSASVCLLLLSQNSADSEYVKNELNYAINHRVPVHTLLLESFPLPPDIEMMTSRRQMIGLGEGFDKELVRALPTELMSENGANINADKPSHPLFSIDKFLFDRQGTKTYTGHHLNLGYKCTVQSDDVDLSWKQDMRESIVNASGMNHPVFPQIYDVLIQDNHIWTYQEYRNDQFLDTYLQQNELDQATILSWFYSIVDAMEYLFRKSYTLRDFSRGSITVHSNKQIGIFRLQNTYYGIYRITQETRSYYFDVVLQELSILLAQLCLRESPLIPIRMINLPSYDRRFLDRVNMIIQKCTRINGKAIYNDFSQIKNDIEKDKLSHSDKSLLRERTKRLAAYEKERERRRLNFSADGKIASNPLIPNGKSNGVPAPFKPAGGNLYAVPLGANLELEFGYGETALLLSDTDEGDVQIRIQIVSTGQVFESAKRRIIVGRDRGHVDFLWTQPFVSRKHCIIEKVSAFEYKVIDTNATNKLYVQLPGEEIRVLSNAEQCIVPPGTLVRLASPDADMILL